jgi:hypothetical protein
MMIYTAPQLIHVKEVFAKVPGVPAREVTRAMRRLNPVTVLRMQTAMMKYFVTVQRPVILMPVVDRAVTPALTMGHSAMVMKVAMRKLISA